MVEIRKNASKKKGRIGLNYDGLKPSNLTFFQFEVENNLTCKVIYLMITNSTLRLRPLPLSVEFRPTGFSAP